MTPEEIIQSLRSQGSLIAAQAPNGQFLTIQPLVFGHASITLGPDDKFIDRSWTYENPAEALAGLLSWVAHWDDESEPDGWIRADMDGRRRPKGDASKEYVHS